MKRWRGNRWVLGDEFLDVQTGSRVQQRIHAYICPELHLLADELDQAEKWALSAGLAGLWVEGYKGPKGGKAAGIGLCSDASVGLENTRLLGVQNWISGIWWLATYIWWFLGASTYLVSTSGLVGGYCGQCSHSVMLGKSYQT